MLVHSYIFILEYSFAFVLPFLQNELMMKWNTQLLTMRSCIIEGKKFSILSNREKGMGLCACMHVHMILNSVYVFI